MIDISLIKAIDEALFEKSKFAQLNDAFLAVHNTMLSILYSHTLLKAESNNAEVQSELDDKYLQDYKEAFQLFIDAIEDVDKILSDNADTDYEDESLVKKINEFNYNTHREYGVALQCVDDETAHKLSSLMFVYQLLFRFFNNTLSSHSNYKGKLVDEEPLIFNADVADIKDFIKNKI